MALFFADYPDRLKNHDLVKSTAYVGGEWTAESIDGKSFDVTNPSTGDKIAQLPDLGIAETRFAIDAAFVAQVDWAKRTGKERASVLRSWHDLMIANADDLAAILCAEMGKPLAEAKGEIVYGASYIEWFAEEAKRIYGDLIPGHQPDKRIMVLRQPVGVVAIYHALEFPKRDDRAQSRTGSRGRMRLCG